jgi:hypothetical protein
VADAILDRKERTELAEEKTAPAPRKIKIGNTVYTVKSQFDNSKRLTVVDRVQRLILREAAQN